MSCFPDSESALKLAITAFASDGGKDALPALAWAWIASSRSVVRPSCRKKILCPSPHRGAVRNSSPLAFPWRMSSARPGPRLCSSKSEKRLARFWLSAALEELPVVRYGVWQRAQPISANDARPRVIDTVSGAGFGGPRNFMKKAKLTTLLTTFVGVDASSVGGSSGVALNRHPGGSSRSVGH